MNKGTLRWRTATTGPCHNCRRTILSGTDRDRAALDAHTDPQPLTWAGELAARFIDGRRTFVYVAGALTHRLMPQHGAEHTYPVFAEHRCHQPIPPAWLAPTPPPAPTSTANTTGVPF